MFYDNVMYIASCGRMALIADPVYMCEWVLYQHPQPCHGWITFVVQRQDFDQRQDFEPNTNDTTASCKLKES